MSVFGSSLSCLLGNNMLRDLRVYLVMSFDSSDQAYILSIGFGVIIAVIGAFFIRNIHLNPDEKQRFLLYFNGE